MGWSWPWTQDREVLARLDALLAAVEVVRKQGVKMATELDALKAQVAETLGVEQSAVTLLLGIVDKIAALVAAGGSPADFTKLATDLKTSADSLAAAVAAVPAL